MQSTDQTLEERRLSMIANRYTKEQLYEAYLVEHREVQQLVLQLKRANRLIAKVRFDTKL